MKPAHEMALLVSKMLEYQIETQPQETILAFAGLYCGMGVRMGIPLEDAMNMIRNIYQDVYADAQEKAH